MEDGRKLPDKTAGGSHGRSSESEAQKNPDLTTDRGLDATFEAALKLTAAGIAGEVTALTIVLHAPVSPSKLTSCRMENAGMVDLAVSITRRAIPIAGGAMMMPRRSERRRGKGRNSR